MIRKIMILGLISTLFGCGDGKPGMFSASGYHIGKQKVWYKSVSGMAINISEVIGADASTFAPRRINCKTSDESMEFGMDAQSIFWSDSKLEGADPASFEYLGGSYSKDKRRAYYMSQTLTEDMAHFEIVSRQFVKDSRHVYFGSSVFSGDPAHFTRVGAEGSNYFKDSQKCWYDLYELKGADPATIEYLGPKTAQDATHIYHEMSEVEGADLPSYQILPLGFAKDKHHVYRQGQRLESADPASFKVLDENYCLDNQHCFYYLSIIEGADATTFQLIEPGYAKDAKSVYINGKRIQDADPISFKVLDNNAGISRDAHHRYSMDQPTD